MELAVPYSSRHMSSSGASRSLAARLSTACASGDLPSAKAAVADGASVNEKGRVPGWGGSVLPLTTAVSERHFEVVVWLLSHGADPNGDKVMFHNAYNSTATILQLLIDAGGDVNRKSGGAAPLIWAILGFSREDNVRALLTQLSLDFTVKNNGRTPEQYACDYGTPVVVDIIAHEVSGEGASCFVCAVRFLC